MKTKNLSFFLATFCIASILFLSSCKKDSDRSTTVTISVSPDLVQVSPSPPASTNNPAIIYKMSVTEDDSNQKYNLNLNQIEGFSYEKGYTYKLKIRKTPIANPAADGPITSYILIEIITKVKS